MLKINGVVMPTPKEFKVGLDDIDDGTERNARGDLLRDRIANDKRKLECSWGPLSPSDISKILKAVEPVFFQCEYPDPKEGKLVIKTMYAGPKSSLIYSYINEQPKWEGLSFNIIER